MITIAGMWEPGFTADQNFIEWRIWKEVVQAYAVDRWIMVGPENVGSLLFERFDSMPEALDTTAGARFLLSRAAARDIRTVYWPDDIVLVFGNADDDLSVYQRPEDAAITIPTPSPIAAFAATCAHVALHEIHA